MTNTSLFPLPTALFPDPILDKRPPVKISLDCPSCIRVVGCSGRLGAETLLPSLRFSAGTMGRFRLRNCFHGAALAALLVVAAGPRGTVVAASLDKSLAALGAVDKDGKGHAAAQQAMRDLETAHAADLPAILQALDKASPLGANWIRNAFESVADRELSGRSIRCPSAQLEAVRPRQVASAAGAAAGV